MKAVVFTLGCKVNEVESASIAAALEACGWKTDVSLGYAEAYVLNTCAVTREAEKKSRQLIARARKFNPQAKIFVCGCASEKDRKSFEERGVTFITGARKKQEIIQAFSREYGVENKSLPFPKQSRTRAFIKIQDGCNNFCSYCIIPYLRGREVSRPVEEVIKEVQACACPEVVLNGINISSYAGGLDKLITALKDCEKRIRLGSLECRVITEEFLTALKHLKNFAPQFHLSLQSGSTAVLKAMNRHYTREEYIAKCKLIYSYFPEAAITTDIIAGFPTETEEQFKQSLSIIEEVGFARIHAFAFSAREGTAAYKMKDLPPETKSERLHRLLAAGQACAEKFASRFIGSVQRVIAEDFNAGFTCGYTGNYIRVFVNGKLQSGESYAVKIKQLYKDGVLAELNG